MQIKLHHTSEEYPNVAVESSCTKKKSTVTCNEQLDEWLDVDFYN